MTVSLALHALALAVLLATARPADERRPPAGRAASSLVLAALPFSVPELAPGPPLPVALAAATARDAGAAHRPARARGARAAMVADAMPARPEPVAPPPWPELAPVTDERVEGMATAVTEPSAVAAPSVTSGSGETADQGAGTGDGPELEPFGEGTERRGGGVRRRRRPLELFARVIGGGIPSGAPNAGGRPFVSLKEATALRTHDFFPRLPAAAWTERHPYGVVIDLCVSEDGRVTDAVLLSAESPRFDPLVLDAVRGWHYRPRLVDGRPAPFCHEVVIRYDAP